jgi:HEAT repeat protein
VRYLAAVHLGERGEPEAIPALLKRLETSAKTQDAVGFWWCCEALAQLRAKDAIPLLANYATPTNPAGFYGPEGMPLGYIAAATLARLAADVKQSDVARLLKSDNIWLKAGVLRGLSEANAAGVEELLQEASKEDNAALTREEARVQLQRRER